jgi:hypothetical protein
MRYASPRNDHKSWRRKRGEEKNSYFLTRKGFYYYRMGLKLTPKSITQTQVGKIHPLGPEDIPPLQSR